MSVTSAVTTPRAFYNEIEPYAVRWLRNLESEGLIANGVIEDRSIRDLTGAELRDFTQCHFFAGIGIWQLALTLAGWPDDLPVWTGSCPCQPFSAAGAGKGVDDDRHLWPDWYKLIVECRPAIIFGEQVASADGLEWLDVVCTDLERAGYSVGAADLCAAGIGAPHLRQRLYFMAYANDVLPRLRVLLRQATRRGKGSLAQARGRRQASKLEHANGVSGDGFTGSVHRTETTRALERLLNGREDHGSQRTSQTLDVADSARSGRAEGCEPIAASGEHGRGSSDDREPCIVGNAVGVVEQGSGNAGSEGGAWVLVDDHRIIYASEVSVMEHADGEGSQRRSLLVGNERGERAVRCAGPLDGATRGFWHPADWILCRPEPGRDDWRWRAVEPGAFPLAHGDPARVGKLRAYGNAIVEPLAQEFVETVIELLTEESE